MYALVLMRAPRYIGALIVLVLAVALAAVRLEPANRRLARAILVSGLMLFTLIKLPAVFDAVAAASNRSPNPAVEAAEALRRSGIGPNTHVATVGTGIFAFWARLARLNLAAEIWDQDVPLFWGADVVRRRQMLCVMARGGSSAVVGVPSPGVNVEGWEPLGKSGYWMHRLSESDCKLQ
jgi:hypothetical protein